MRIHTCPINTYTTGEIPMYTYATAIGAVGFGIIGALTLDSAPTFAIVCLGMAVGLFTLMEYFGRHGK